MAQATQEKNLRGNPVRQDRMTIEVSGGSNRAPTMAEYRKRIRFSTARSGGRGLVGTQHHAPSAGQPLITVITVAMNAEASLERTINSVLAQTYPHVEYIVLDGGSHDRTPEILQDYSDRIAFWSTEPDAGIYDAMNKGISIASGDWIHLLNADDVYTSADALANIAPLLDEKMTNYFALYLESAEGERRMHRFSYSPWMQFVKANIIHPSLLVSRLQYEKVGLYDTSFPLAADHDFILRLSRSFPPRGSDFPLVVMRQTGASHRQLWSACREFRDVTIRHGAPRLAAELLAPLKYCLWKLPLAWRRFIRNAISPASSYRKATEVSPP